MVLSFLKGRCGFIMAVLTICVYFKNTFEPVCL